MEARSTKDGPFCWQSKEALRHIREVFDQSRDVSSALSVYLALSEVASNSAAAAFTTTQADLAQRAGLSVRKVADVLKKMAAVKLVSPSSAATCGASIATIWRSCASA